MTVKAMEFNMSTLNACLNSNDREIQKRSEDASNSSADMVKEFSRTIGNEVAVEDTMKVMKEGIFTGCIAKTNDFVDPAEKQINETKLNLSKKKF